ncbi:MAG: alpha-galactosidase [Kiritimatiellae bacterium]|nr:alpha-galactosidase [Kiritimatiellia bacterium]
MVSMVLAVATAFSFGQVKVECEKQGDWKVELVREVAPDGAEVAKITLDSAEAKVPPKTTLSLLVPQVGADYVWSVNQGECGLRADWGGWSTTEVAQGMPVFVYFDGNDTSHFAVAAEECVRHLRCGGGIREEGSFLNVRIVYFDAVEAPLTHYETRVRFDPRPKYFGDAVRESVSWVEKTGGYVPCKVPEAAFDPLYSSWYNFHQDVHDRDIEAELAIAAKLGMKTFIVDDGWQTEDNNRGYAFCGDWQIAKSRFPDMAAHVKRVQDMGIKYMMWYSVPFIGIKSANYEKFKGKYVTENDRGLGAGTLDPRFPEVRRFIVDTYVKALRDWNIDGFKLDFIDTIQFRGPDPAVAENYAGRDIKSLPLAVDTLMTEVKAALTAIKPDILVEFRQQYVGPAIRKYGNMLRVGDCPGNMSRNRFAMANLRLASGGTAVHSDMLEWNFGETPERAALYVINSMFGAVQYSVMLRNAPKDHLAMLEKWIKFSQDHRETLLKGRFMPHHPELQYPVIEAEGENEVVIGLYDDGRVVDVPSKKKTFVMNASGKDSFVIRRDGRLSEVACRSGDWTEL